MAHCPALTCSMQLRLTRCRARRDLAIGIGALVVVFGTPGQALAVASDRPGMLAPGTLFLHMNLGSYLLLVIWWMLPASISIACFIGLRSIAAQGTSDFAERSDADV